MMKSSAGSAVGLVAAFELRTKPIFVYETAGNSDRAAVIATTFVLSLILKVLLLLSADLGVESGEGAAYGLLTIRRRTGAAIDTTNRNASGLGASTRGGDTDVHTSQAAQPSPSPNAKSETRSSGRNPGATPTAIISASGQKPMCQPPGAMSVKPLKRHSPMVGEGSGSV
jgi:hypothetical protein